jgi:asparagine N-glycosylation enzyme membrane subunit Stt3
MEMISRENFVIKIGNVSMLILSSTFTCIYAFVAGSRFVALLSCCSSI